MVGKELKESHVGGIINMALVTEKIASLSIGAKSVGSMATLKLIAISTETTRMIGDQRVRERRSMTEDKAGTEREEPRPTETNKNFLFE